MPKRSAACTTVLEILTASGSSAARDGMERFGIPSHNALGVRIPQLRKLACQIGVDHRLASELWGAGILEGRILAALIADPNRITARQMDVWASQFDSWAVCDACCCNLFDKTSHAYRKAAEWSRRKEEYVKRAAFSLMAGLAAHDRSAPDAEFLRFFPLIKFAAADERNFVKKAVNWALRQIGKRNPKLNIASIRVAESLRKLESPAARWVGADALRELRSAAVQKRLQDRGERLRRRQEGLARLHTRTPY